MNKIISYQDKVIQDIKKYGSFIEALKNVR